ncbi:hypothetical protein ADICYQ_2603 [Cyclobacterium qasimii M12-11B]|uniref:Uncharacterized protein n=1 Tax=Cyclobacterium qasimii M12-11B TaxID=641524 RepID=S7VFT7_9BACT|nr:hypothetical protein ADICYQ_2603 [Cyclobacterium qasimii M12-11B]
MFMKAKTGENLAKEEDNKKNFNRLQIQQSESSIHYNKD